MNGPTEPDSKKPSVNTSLQEATATCESLSTALGALNIAEIVENAKSGGEYALILEYKTQIVAMRTTATESLATVQDLRKTTPDETTVTAFEEIEKEFDKFLTGIEGLLARVVEWIEDYERESGRETGNSASAA